MNGDKRCFVFITAFILLSIFILYYSLNNTVSFQQLEYDYSESSHQQFYIDGSYVVFVEDITVKNNTNNDFHFLMEADYSDDRGLISETKIMAYEETSMEKKQFFIKANTTKSYVVFFKGLKGEQDQKANRLPPKSIKFSGLIIWHGSMGIDQ